MSLLVTELELPEVVEPYSIPEVVVAQRPEVVVAQRLVDSATRLHAWSIPEPCCIHGNPLDLRCDGCDDLAPFDPLSDLT